MNPSSITKVDIGTVTMGDNPRLPVGLDIPALSENIGEVGLLEPIHIYYPEDGNVAEVLRGHRRTMGLTMLKDQNPKRFNELFPEGISAIVWDDITAEEVVMLKLDHGGQKTLTNPHELQMSANMMFGQSMTESQVANQLKPLITRISPMGSTQKGKIVVLEEALDKAKADKSERGIEKAEKELAERISEMYRGRVQHLHHVYRCPHMVNASLYFNACGIKPQGFEEETLPRLTTSQVKGLWKAHKEDLEVVDEESQAPKYNKDRVGPNFATKWEAIIIADGQPKAEKEKQAKAMSSKDMKLEVTEGKWESIGFCKLTQHHSGNKSIDGLAELDKAYKAFDLVRAGNADLLDMVITEASKLEAELIASDKEAQKETEEVVEG